MHRQDSSSSASDAGHRLRPVTKRLIVVGVAVMVFGLLLWAKLLLVTGHPRTAIADPDGESTSDSVTQRDEPPGADGGESDLRVMQER